MLPTASVEIQLAAQYIDLFSCHLALWALAPFAALDALVDGDSGGVFAQRLVAAGALEIGRGDPLAKPLSAVITDFVVGLDGFAVFAQILIGFADLEPGLGGAVAFEHLLREHLVE